MTDIKCANCGKKLGEASIQEGELRIKCKCGSTTVIMARQVALPVKKDSYTEKISKDIEKK